MNELLAFYSYLRENSGDNLSELLKEFEMDSSTFTKEHLSNISEEEIDRLFHFLIYYSLDLAGLDHGDVFQYLTGPDVGMDAEKAIYLIEMDDED